MSRMQLRHRRERKKQARRLAYIPYDTSSNLDWLLIAENVSSDLYQVNDYLRKHGIMVWRATSCDPPEGSMGGLRRMDVCSLWASDARVRRWLVTQKPEWVVSITRPSPEEHDRYFPGPFSHFRPYQQ